MGRVSSYAVPNTYEKEFAYNEGDWRGWEDITQEEIDIAKSNGIDKELLYQRVEVNFMPISKAITKPKNYYNGTVITAEQSRLISKLGLVRRRVYTSMKINNLSFDDALERVQYLDNYRKYLKIAEENGVSEKTFRNRVYRGKSWEECVKPTQPRTTKEQRQFAKDKGYGMANIYKHMKNNGYTFEEVMIMYAKKRGFNTISKRGVLNESKS